MPAAARKKRQPHAGSLDRLLSGKVEPAAAKRKKARKKEPIVELLPDELRPLADVLTAGRKIEKEIRFKIEYSERRVKDYCTRRFCENYASSGHRPPSAEYAGNRSRFTFVQTRKVYLTPEKVETLRAMRVPIDDYTVLNGIEINYDAIRQHHLEFKLKTALQRLNVPDDIIDDIFQPRIEVKESLMEVFNAMVERSLGPRENLPEKMYQVLKVLQPVNQIKTSDLSDTTPLECFKLVESAAVRPAPNDKDDEDEDKGSAA